MEKKTGSKTVTPGFYKETAYKILFIKKTIYYKITGILYILDSFYSSLIKRTESVILKIFGNSHYICVVG